MRFEDGCHFIESDFGLHLNNGGVIFSAQLPNLFSSEHVRPVTDINITFHPANIRDSVSHDFIIPPLAGLSYRNDIGSGRGRHSLIRFPSSRHMDSVVTLTAIWDRV